MNKKLIKNLFMTAAGVLAIAFVFLTNPVSVMAAGTGAVAINSVTIGGSNVNIVASASDLPASDDGIYYLYAEKVYQNGPSGNAVATAAVGPNAVFSVPLGMNTTECRLYDKFQICVLQGGSMVPVTNPRYITNPEVLGTAVAAKNNGKKGIILDGAKIGNGNNEVVELGVQQAAYNINLEDVIGGNGAVQYSYNGKVYGFDSVKLSQYDHCVRTTSNQGIGLTMVLLNPYAKGEEFMISPSSRGGIGRSNYYMMNTSEQKGLEYLEAVVSFLANRYNGRNGFGQVDNWVVANEVNAKNVWNYSSVSDELTYAQLYVDSLRVCYNAIKSKNSNATVCISLDQNWTHVHNPGSYYSARSMIEAINAVAKAQGNFDWAVAEHPYNYPMTWTSFWTPKNETAAAMIQHNINTPYLSMQNIEQLTDYLSLPEMRNTKGNVRPVLLTEIGYSSTQGEEAQAYAMVYAYQRAMTNSHIKMIIFNRQTDYPLEVRQGLSVGLTDQNGRRKLAFEVFKQMNGANGGTYVQQAAAYMGIANWNAEMNAR
ncbi:DUF5722 domain-containing protein [Butyrivibrio sp. VCB2006]|uniref:DUF5722 domain-containing protein n=1 Tax=Butyrivibrio sp. VCB2006 TaxID=1280679 RepID=UPI00041C5548|nr:DUF5722 domain-containing protein [Butyrivibrio sp. VCB2006]